MKKFITTILFLSILICLLPADLVAQNKKNGSSFLDNLYNSSQNQRRNQRSNNSTSELEKLLQDAKKKTERKKEEKKAKQQTTESYDPDAFFYDFPDEGKDKKNKNSGKNNKEKDDLHSKMEQDDIALVVNGEGPNKTEATKNALRSALEQTYGTFVSANTQILNDELVRDEIATVSSGNIKSYKELSSMQLPNGNISVSLSAIVSIGKLVKYVQSHGGTAEFAGQTFMMNIRMRELNKINELAALNNMIVLLQGLAGDLFDCNIDVKDPQIVDKKAIASGAMNIGGKVYHENNGHYMSEQYYNVPITVSITTNSTYALFQEILSKTLSALSLSGDEIVEYNSNNMSVQAYMPYGSGDESNFYFYGSEQCNEIYFLRNDIETLMGINDQICSILNDAQRSFYVQAQGGPRKEWTPSEREIINVHSRKGFNLSGAYKTPMVKKGRVGDYVQTQFGEKKVSSVPMGVGVVFNTITHLFQYDNESLGGVQGFEVIKKSQNNELKDLIIQPFTNTPAELTNKTFTTTYFSTKRNGAWSAWSNLHSTIKVDFSTSFIDFPYLDKTYSITEVGNWEDADDGWKRLIIKCMTNGNECEIRLLKGHGRRQIYILEDNSLSQDYAFEIQ